jgi:MOSC domain-containing protein YiiM
MKASIILEQHTGRIVTLQVGVPTHHPTSVPANGVKTWQTSFFRVPSATPRWLFTTHLDGNEQADKEHHGQWNQVMLFYAAAHYPLWQTELDLPVIGPGGFGENATVEGQSEATVCLGDRYAIGDAIIQITGPRYPCWKNNQRWGVAELLERIKANGRTGWYCSVAQEGMLAPGDAITLLDRPFPRWTIALINDFAHGHNADAALAEELCACPLLDDGFWPTVIHTALKKRRVK